MIISNNPAPPDSVALHYDELDLFYRDVWGEHLHHGLWISGHESTEVAVRQLVELVAKQAGIQGISRVCDVGCGYGATARMLVREFGAMVTAVTISQAQYDYALKTPAASDNPEYLLRDWLSNGLASSAFDAVIAIESSEHIQDKQAFFTEAFRVLRPGGKLVVCAWLSSENPGGWQKRRLLEPICREGRLPGMGTETEYLQFLQRAGFEEYNCQDLTAQVEKTWPTCIGRALKQLCTQPRYLRFLLDRRRHNRIFALTMFRIWLAYRTGAMRYGIFSASTPGE